LFYYFQSFIWVFTNGQVLYLTMYLIATILGNAVSEVFYAFNLLDLITRNESLQNVIKSVTLNAKALLLTVLLGSLFLYYFSIWATLFLQTDFVTEDEVLCESLFECWQAMFEYALLTGSSSNGIGQPLRGETNYNDRFIFDLIFFVVIILIFLNVFFGIIIDTFGELRGRRSEKEEDMKNVCFICSIDRTTFDRNGNGFDYHISAEHNLWNYVYFIVYIKTKDER